MRERGAEFGETDHADGTACHVAPRRRVEKHLFSTQRVRSGLKGAGFRIEGSESRSRVKGSSSSVEGSRSRVTSSGLTTQACRKDLGGSGMF